MKKIIVLLLALALCLPFFGCDEKSGDKDSIGANIDFNVPEFELDVPPAVTVGKNEIDFNVPEIELDVPPAVTVGDISDRVINIDFPDFDFDFSCEPVEVKAHNISFEFADFDYTFDIDTFDVKEFAKISVDNFSQADAIEIEQMDAKDVIAIAETRANLLADLSHAFKTSGLAVTVNEDIGEIMLDSSVLFGVDESAVSPAGKEFLQKFLAVYTSVVFNEKYEGFISRVLVEGHTDSTGSYDHNLTLSQDRAKSVMAFCLSDESDLDAASIALMEDSLEAIGYACDKLIYDESGNEDKDASRRVSFRFLIFLS